MNELLMLALARTRKIGEVAGGPVIVEAKLAQAHKELLQNGSQVFKFSTGLTGCFFPGF